MTSLENPIKTALRGKGLSKFLDRGASIVRRYGWTPARMERALTQLAVTLQEFGASATLPITAVALDRAPQVIQKLQDQGIEFAIHGYRHIDHSLLDAQSQLAQLEAAKRIFERNGIHVWGFRGPYLRRNDQTPAALRSAGLDYDATDGLFWDVLEGENPPDYEHVLGFYAAKPAAQVLSLPHLESNLVHIPYSLPDDEALVERLALDTPDRMDDLWLGILSRTHNLGELFVLGLHPERTMLCLQPLRAVLDRARSLVPGVWIAHLREIAEWWRLRSAAEIQIVQERDDTYQITVAGPPGTVLLARNVQTDPPATPWADPYQLVQGSTCTVRAPVRPWIGLSPQVSPEATSILQQQGYITEPFESPGHHSYYLDAWATGSPNKRALLAQFQEDRPLIKLGRWPNGCKSALAITGDIDALTLWGYALRLVGK